MIVGKVDNGYSMFCAKLGDEWMLVDEWNENIKNNDDAFEECRITIDDYLENPSDYEDK